MANSLMSLVLREMCLLAATYNHLLENQITVEGVGILPTEKQAIICTFVCQMLSNAFQPINVFRYDQKLKTIYIQAGVNDNLAIVIDQNGEWEFI